MKARLFPIDRLQIAEDARDDCAGGRRGEVIVMELDGLASDCGDALSARVAIEQGPLVEGVDEQDSALSDRSDDEVVWQIDAGHREADAIGDGEVNDGKADRDSEPAIDDLIDVGIAGVFVVGRVALESLFLEEHAVDLSEDLADPRAVGATVAHAGGPAVEHGLDCGLVDLGVGVARDFDGDGGEVGVLVGLDEPPEFGAVGDTVLQRPDSGGKGRRQLF